jgi:hypothetical protein
MDDSRKILSWGIAGFGLFAVLWGLGGNAHDDMTSARLFVGVILVIIGALLHGGES